MNKLFLAVVIVVCSAFSLSVFAGETPKNMKCLGSNVAGKPVIVLLTVLNTKQIENLKVQFKKQVVVNEVSRVAGEAYSDAFIKNHLSFTAKTDQDIALLLPVNFRMLKSTTAYLSQSSGDDISFTTLNCVFQ